MAKKLFVGSLAWATTDESLNQFFSQVGTVTSATVIKDKYTGRSRGFGFVEMEVDDEAQKAVDELNGKELDGRAIVVNEARPMEPRDNNRGGGFNRDDNSGSSDSSESAAPTEDSETPAPAEQSAEEENKE